MYQVWFGATSKRGTDSLNAGWLMSYFARPKMSPSYSRNVSFQRLRSIKARLRAFAAVGGLRPGVLRRVRFRSRGELQAPFMGLLAVVVICGRDARAPGFAGGVQADSSLECGHLARFCFCGRDARAPRFADGVEAVSSVERGHLARICRCGRDARAPRFAGETPALPELRTGRPRSVICPRSIDGANLSYRLFSRSK